MNYQIVHIFFLKYNKTKYWLKVFNRNFDLHPDIQTFFQIWSISKKFATKICGPETPQRRDRLSIWFFFYIKIEIFRVKMRWSREMMKPLSLPVLLLPAVLLLHSPLLVVGKHVQKILTKTRDLNPDLVKNGSGSLYLRVLFLSI